MIEVKNISKTFFRTKEPFKALHDISLDVAQGDIVGIIGFSGAGKSTLIRCINLLERPDEGHVIVNGVELTKLSSSQLARERKKIGMIFQHFNLLSSRTVFENVAFPLELDKRDKTYIRGKVHELLTIVGLEDKADDYPSSLSGGQKQRVAIARALANDPYVLLSDEATSALDPATTQSILQLLQDINRRMHITILLITHEMEVVKAVCNHVAVIDKGRLIAKGTLAEILAKKDHPVIKQFLTSKALTIPGELSAVLRREYVEGLFPVVEIRLDGSVAFEELVSSLSPGGKAVFQLLNADVEYIGQANFGQVLVRLKGTRDENDTVLRALGRQNIHYLIRGYA